jgi:hypothetical protein
LLRFRRRTCRDVLQNQPLALSYRLLALSFSPHQLARADRDFFLTMQAKGQCLKRPRAALPRTLRYPGNLTLERESTEAQAAEAEFTQKSARPSADAAAIAVLCGKLRFLVRLGDLCCCCHFFLRSASRPSLRAFVS